MMLCLLLSPFQTDLGYVYELGLNEVVDPLIFGRDLDVIQPYVASIDTTRLGTTSLTIPGESGSNLWTIHVRNESPFRKDINI